MDICILIDNNPTDVLTINVDKNLSAEDKADYINEKVLAFTKAEICNVSAYSKINNHKFMVQSSKGTQYNISWKKITVWTEEELNNL